MLFDFKKHNTESKKNKFNQAKELAKSISYEELDSLKDKYIIDILKWIKKEDERIAYLYGSPPCYEIRTIPEYEEPTLVIQMKVDRCIIKVIGYWERE